MKKTYPWHIILPLVAVVIVGIIGIVVSRQPQIPPEQALMVTENDHVRGEKEAPVTLMEFKDFQCPGCAGYAPLVSQLEKEFAGKVRVVYRHFPLISLHPNALLAAQAAEAAALQGKFWEMHDLLFQKQQEWASVRSPLSLFQGYASTIGLDVAEFDSDIASQEVQDAVREDLRTAQSLGLTGTPTFFINGARIEAPSDYQAFKTLLEQAVAGGSMDVVSTTPAVVPQVKGA